MHLFFRIPLLWPFLLLIQVHVIIVNNYSTGDGFGDYLRMISESYETPRKEMLPSFLSKSVPPVIFFTAMVALGFRISN
jgi:hypothetical protein